MYGVCLCVGVGRTMSSKLASLGVTTCGDLQQLSIVRLQKEFGPRTGQTLFRFCRGLDDRLVRSEKERKSVSAEMNYNIRFTKVRSDTVNPSLKCFYIICMGCMFCITELCLAFLLDISSLMM